MEASAITRFDVLDALDRLGMLSLDQLCSAMHWDRTKTERVVGKLSGDAAIVTVTAGFPSSPRSWTAYLALTRDGREQLHRLRAEQEAA